MYKNVTLNQFIGELQKLAAEHGNDEILSIGSSSGKIAGMSSPFCFNFKGHDATEFVAAYQQDVKAAPSQGPGTRDQGPGKVSAKVDDFNGANARGIDEVGYAQDLHKKWMEGSLRNVWARVGMSLLVTPEEEKAIFEGDYLDGKEAVMRVIEAGRASVDGETYIPEECIESFDEEYGTNYRNREEECAWSMDGEFVNAGGPVPMLTRLDLPGVERVEVSEPCKLGDSVFVLFFDEESGTTEIDELKVTEVSTKRIWVAGDDGFDYNVNDIGKTVFLSREAAEEYLRSPEYLASRVNMVMQLNVSDSAKKELLVGGFEAGQEYYERDVERFFKLTSKVAFDIWEFDVFDKNKELAYSTTETAGRLALDMLNGDIVPATMVQEKSVSELISDASDKVLLSNNDREGKAEVSFSKD